MIFKIFYLFIFLNEILVSYDDITVINEICIIENSRHHSIHGLVVSYDECTIDIVCPSYILDSEECHVSWPTVNIKEDGKIIKKNNKIALIRTDNPGVRLYNSTLGFETHKKYELIYHRKYCPYDKYIKYTNMYFHNKKEDGFLILHYLGIDNTLDLVGGGIIYYNGDIMGISAYNKATTDGGIEYVIPADDIKEFIKNEK